MRRLSRAARVAGGVALLGLGLVRAEVVRAHPMPNTVIAVSLGDGGAVFDIAIPVRELRLALPGPVSPTASLLDEPLRTTTSRYLEAHCRVLSPTGASVPVTVLTLDLWDALDANVGQYQELRARLRVEASGGVNPRDFLLAYDAVIHQIPNHFALVEIIRDFRAGVVAETDAVEVGVIRYDFRTKLTPPLRITAAPAGLWPGVRSVTALGFHHVAAGYDHLLFLLTLLIVAPLRPVGGRWSLFQGWRYTLRRFLAISIAFTLGHSAALLAGVYELVPVPRAAIEVLIALSILTTALHALRPIFSGREWLVAMLFGTVHGLAFVDSLGALALTPGMRAVAVAGFNLGVEGAQLVAMACALPLLAASRWRGYHLIRTALMVSAVVLATWWMIDRGAALVASTS